MKPQTRKITSKGNKLSPVAKEIKNLALSLEAIITAPYCKEFLQDPIFNNYIRTKLLSVAKALENAEEQIELPFKELRAEREGLYTTLKSN